MVAVNSLEIQRALEAQVMNILEGIKSILEKTPPELVAAINDHGIILTGGGALIDGLDRVITRSVGIACLFGRISKICCNQRGCKSS